jgi:hypothetical protein
MDQSRDRLDECLYRIVSLHNPPEYVKSASEADLKADALTSGHLFAEPTTRAYPAHTRAAAWLSAAYLCEKRGELDPAQFARIEKRLTDFAGFWEIDEDLAALRASYAPIEKDAAADMAVGDIEIIVNGETHRVCPVRNEWEFKAATDWLQEHEDKLPPDQRRVIAQGLQGRAHAQFHSLPVKQPLLYRLAGDGACTPKQAAQLVAERIDRAESTKRKSLARDLVKLACELDKAALEDMTPETLHKLEDYLVTVDREIGLEPFYDKSASRPRDVLYAIDQPTIEKFASAHVRTTTGTLYHVADFEKLSLDQLREHLGEELAEAATDDGCLVDTVKLAELVETLPRGDAQIFDDLCAGLGIALVSKRACAAPEDRLGLGGLERLAGPS